MILVGESSGIISREDDDGDDDAAQPASGESDSLTSGLEVLPQTPPWQKLR